MSLAREVREGGQILCSRWRGGVPLGQKGWFIEEEEIAKISLSLFSENHKIEKLFISSIIGSIQSLLTIYILSYSNMNTIKQRTFKYRYPREEKPYYAEYVPVVAEGAKPLKMDAVFPFGVLSTLTHDIWKLGHVEEFKGKEELLRKTTETLQDAIQVNKGVLFNASINSSFGEHSYELDIDLQVRKRKIHESESESTDNVSPKKIKLDSSPKEASGSDDSKEKIKIEKEKAKLDKEKAKQDKEKAKQDKEKAKQDKIDKANQAKIDKEKLKLEKAEKLRMEKEQKEQLKLDKMEAAKKAKLDKEKAKQDKIDQANQAKIDKENLKIEKAEKLRMEKEQKEQLKLDKMEAANKAKLEKEKIKLQKIEAANKAKLDKEKAKLDKIKEKENKLKEKKIQSKNNIASQDDNTAGCQNDDSSNNDIVQEIHFNED